MSFVIVPEAPAAHAVDIGLYELDGDVTNGPAPGVDAENLRAGTSGAIATTVVSDPVNTGSDIMFQSGGGAFTAKDTGDVSQWRWTTKEPSDKLDLIDVLAAQYVDSSSEDPFVYIGATRYDGSGASTLGFWFLQDPVELGAGGRFTSIETGNPATHIDGDVLIVADFGGTNQLDIYRWSGTGPVLESTTSLSCLAATAATPACGVSNPTVISSPWPIEQKGYPSDQIGPDAFVELGLNLQSTLGNNLGCYQSIIATSRTSDSITATLNDFALAGVSTCDVSITKSGPSSVAAGETATYSFEISNDGITPLSLDSVTDDVLGIMTTEATAAGCDSLRGGESCSFTVDYSVPAGQAAGPLTNTVTAEYQPPNGRTTASATDSHTTQVYRPALTVTKTADLDPANVGATITYTYVITNTTDDPSGSAAPPMTINSVDDDLIGTIDATSCGTLSTGASCSLTASDIPDGAIDPLINQVDVSAAWGAITRSASASESVDVNRAPTASDDDYVTDEDTVLTITAPGILTNDSDADGDTLAVQPVPDTVDGDLTVGADGSLTFDPAGDFESLGAGESTSVSFNYTASDPGGLSAAATVEITINGVNDPVDASPDSYTIDEGQTLSVPAAGVLANDSDPDTNDSLTVSAFDTTSTGGGTVSVAADGSFTYTPAPGFTGTDTFTYTASDGNGSSVTVTVTITVSPAPDVAIGDAEVTEGGTLEFDVTLSRSFSASIDVTLSTSDGSATEGDDYTATSVTVTFAPGDTTATVSVPTTADSTDEPDETLTLSVTGSSSPIGDTSDTGTGTITDDDDAPAVAISDASADEGSDLLFIVSLSNPSSEAITLNLTTADVEAVAGVDYAAGPYAVTIPAGDTSVTVPVTALQDLVDEPAESLTLSVSSTSGGAVGNTSDIGTGTIIDDDPAPSVTIGDATVTEGGSLAFAVTLSNPSSSSIQVTVGTSGVTATPSDDYDGTPTTLTFAPGETSAAAFVSTVEDSIDESDETLSLGVTFVLGSVGDTSDTGIGTILDDDAAPDVVIGDVSVTEGGDLVFDVTLSNPSSSPIDVELATTDVSALAGDDYTSTTGTVSFAPGVTSGSFTVPTIEDAIDEPDETLTVSVTGSTGPVGDTTDVGTGTILDDDAAPDVVIGDVSVTEGGDLVFDVTLTNPSSTTITVDLATSDGTATAGSDYTATTATVTFGPGDTAETFTVPTTGDLIDEPDETLTVSVTGSTGTVGDTSDSGSGTILDDDAAPDVVIGDVSVTEGGDLVFDVTLTNPSSGTITVDLATADGTATAGVDYPATTGTITFTPGDTAETFTVPTTPDALDEPDETLTVAATASTGTLGDTSDIGTGTILDDDDAPKVLTGDVSVTEGGDLVFDVTLTNPSSTTITVDLATSEGTATEGADYTSTTGTVTFTPGDTVETFTVPTTTDPIDEPDETLTVAVTGSSGSVGDTSDTGTGTILDDDAAPDVLIGDVSVTEGGGLVFDVTLTAASAGTITVDLATADGTATAGSDYTATTGTVTFVPGDTAETLTVSTTGDLVDEPDETLTVSVTGSTGTVGDTSDTGTGTILDDDGAPDVLIGDVSVTEGGDLVIDVTLTNPSSGPITVDLATADGSATAGVDYTSTTGTVTFVPGDTAETFTVSTTGDLVDEPDETLTVSVTGSTGSVGDTTDTGTGTILDDDDAPDVLIDDVSVTEGGDLVLDVTLTAASADTITVDLASADGTATAGVDYTSMTGTVTFVPGDTAETLTVSTTADLIDEPDETLTVAVTGSTGPVGDTSDVGTGTILDDDGTPFVVIADASIIEGGALLFDVTLTGASASIITLDIATADGTAVEGIDYTGVATTLVFAPGATSAAVTVPTTLDAIDEPDETLILAVTGATGTVGNTTDTGTGTILDDDDAPDVTIGDAAAPEGSAITVTVDLSNPSSTDITVTIGTSDDTATAGSDYTPGPYLVTFPAGSTSATFDIPTIDDAFDETDETIDLSVISTTGTVGDVSDTGVATILDDDGPPTVTISDASATEGDDLVFDVTLSNPAAAPITLTLTTSDGSAVAGADYTAAAVSITFASGETAATFTVPTIGDSSDEPDETMAASVTASTGPVGDTSDTGTGSILDDDAAPDVVIGDVTVTEGGDLVFDVTLTNPSTGTITVDLATADGTATAGDDYTAMSRTVSFDPGETAATFTVPTVLDGLDEPDETLAVSVTASTGPVGDTTDTGTGTIADDDPTPDVVVGDAITVEGGDIVFDVTLTAPSAGTVTVTLTSSDGTATAPADYTATSTTVTFDPSETVATVTVPTAADTIAEADETLTLAVTGSTGTLGDTSDIGTGTITDDDAPDLTISDETINEGGVLTFTVEISTTSSVDTIVTLRTSDGTATAGEDYTATTTQVMIAAGDTSTTFTVPTTVDLVDEPDETLTVSVDSVDSGFVADTTDIGTGTIADDDPAPTATLADTSTNEGDDATFTVSLSNASSTDIVLEVTPTTGTAGAGDVDLSPISVTIPAGSTSVTFDVPTTEDIIDEPDETFDVGVTSVVSGTVGDTSDTATGTIIDDDAAPTLSVSNATAVEGDDLVFTLELSNPSSTDITVSVATSDGTALASTDYGPVTANVTIPAGSVTVAVPVGTTEDLLAEPSETMTLTVTGVVAGTVVDPTGEAGIGTITDDDAASVLISDASATEGDPAGFTVTLSNPSSEDTVLVLQPTSGTASGGSDFDATPITVTISAGDTTASVSVSTVEDAVAEPTETFTLAVDSVTSGIVGDTTDTGTGTITDDDAPDVFIDDVTAAEGDALVFTVTLSNPTYETVQVDLTPTGVTATGGADYAAGTVTATFAPGDTSATATVAGIQDTVDENDETFTLAVSSSTGDLGDTSDTGTGTITDDDGPPSATIGDAATVEGGDLSFPITLSNPSSEDITIVISLTDVTATAGDDYTAGTVSVTIPAGATTGTAIVSTLDDTLDEPTETLTAAITSTSGGAVGDTSDTATGSITDNDGAPSVTIGDASAIEGGDLVFDVTLSNPSAQAITVTVITTDGTATDGVDYTGGSFDVTFAAGETTGTVTVGSTDDAVDEPDETFTVSVDSTSGAAVGDTTDVGTGTITDDDLPLTPNVSIGAASVTEGGDLVFAITLDIPAIDTIELQISTADGTATAGSDYAATTTSVTISAGASSASFTVPTTDDLDVEGDETLTATIDSFTGSAAIADGAATGTIIDNDAAIPDVVIGDVTVSEGDTATFTVSLTAPAIDEVTITLTTNDDTAVSGSDYAAITVTVTIPAEASTSTFDVPTIEDLIDEADETFGVSITASTGTLGDTSDAATGSIVDDDPAPSVSIDDVSATEGDDLVFDVTLSNPSSESITVTFVTTDGTATGGVDYTGGSFDVTFAPGETTASVTVRTTGDTDLEPDETLTLSVDSTSGGAVGSTADVGTGTITDDDSMPTPDVTIGDATATEGADLAFAVTLSETTTEDIVLTLSTTDGTALGGVDYSATTVAVTILAGDTAGTLTVSTTGDLIDEPDETLTLAVASVDAGPVGDTSDIGTGTIVDDDGAPSITLDDVSVIEGGDAVIPISFSNPSSEDITITLAIIGGTADDADRPNITVTVTIAAGDTTATATFPTTADTVDEPDETFVVGVASVDAGTVGDISDAATVTILDDDGVLGAITGRVWDDANSNVTIDTGEPDISGVTVELYQAGPDTTFGTGDDVLVDSTVTASPYLFSDLDFGTYQVRVVVGTLTAGYVATGDFDGGIDSEAIATVIDATPVSGVDFGYVDLNDPPVAVDDSATTVGGVTINVVSNDSDPDGDPLAVDAVVQPFNGTVVDNGDGTVTYTPDSGFTGTDDFTYTVCDPAGACDTATVTVTVDLAAGGGTPPPVNNPPDYETGFVPELATLVGGGLGPLPLVDPDGDNVTASIVSGTLPSGLSLNPDGSFGGTATVSGTFVLELELCDDGVPVACVVRPLTIIVDAAVGNTPVPPPPTPEPPQIETPATEPPGPVELDELPFTGLATQSLLALALTLLGAGGVLLRAGRTEP